MATNVDFKQFFAQNKIVALLIAVVLIWAFFWFQTDGDYLTSRNISNLLRQMSITGILACGMVLIIISGEIDLSVGSLLGLLGGVLAILTVNMGLPLLPTLAIVLIGGAAIGLINGYLTAYQKIPSFIVGLGGMLIFRGIILGVTDGQTISPVSDQLIWLGQGYLPKSIGLALAVILVLLTVYLGINDRRSKINKQLPTAPLWRDALRILLISAVALGFILFLNSYDGIPVPVLLLLTLLGIFTYMTKQTVFGRRIYAVGSNMEATRLSGVNVRAVKLWVFGIMGLMCALAGTITTARLGSGSPSAGVNGELDAIAACFIGGASMRGGSGTVYGALIGALVMASLDNGMSMLGVDAFWQLIVKGGILVFAVWVDVTLRSGRR